MQTSLFFNVCMNVKQVYVFIIVYVTEGNTGLLIVSTV